MYRLKETSDTYQRILKAEKTLDELGIKIEFSRAGKGIVIIDTQSGRGFYCAKDNINYTFPRDVDCTFLTPEVGCGF